jgi:hypothetical protein
MLYAGMRMPFDFAQDKRQQGTSSAFVFDFHALRENQTPDRTYAAGVLSLRQPLDTLGNRGTSSVIVCGFFSRSAKKPHTEG